MLCIKALALPELGENENSGRHTCTSVKDVIYYIHLAHNRIFQQDLWAALICIILTGLMCEVGNMVCRLRYGVRDFEISSDRFTCI